MLNTDTVT